MTADQHGSTAGAPESAESPHTPSAPIGGVQRVSVPGRRLLAAAVAAVAVLVVVLLLQAGGGHDTPKPTPVTHSPPVAVSAAQLKALPAALGHAVYWVGPRPRYTYELTRFSDGGVWIRYLPPGVPVGTPAQRYVTIGSYPVNDAYAVAERGSHRTGATSRPVRNRGLSVTPAAHPQNVYVTYPGSNVLIEVYTPSAPRSRQIASSQRLAPLR